MRLNLVVASLIVAFGNVDNALAAQDTKKDETGNKVVVTGSLIKKTDLDGPAPILTLTSEDLAKLGHTNLYDALISLTAQTGSIAEGDQFPNGFTAAAQAINLRGFGPGRTLVLVNGQRFALNPTPYQSEANFFNLATIPMVAIERVDVLTDSASAIYGSDAIAGVINVILREEFESSEVSITFGDTTRGGGESQKISGGNSVRSDDSLFTFGYQWESREAIYAQDRSYLEPVNVLGPNVTYPIAIGVYNISNDIFEFATQENCQDQGLFLGGVQTGGGVGPACGRGIVGTSSLRSKRDSFSMFSHFSTDIGYGRWNTDIVYWQSETSTRSGPLGWSGFIPPSGAPEYFVIREFSYEETGNQDSFFDESSVSLTSNYEGMAESFDYRYTVTLSDYDHKQKVPSLITTEIDNFFSTPQSVFNVLNPENFTNIIADQVIDANSQSYNLSYWMSGDGFEFNGESSTYALLMEWNQSGYKISPDERTINNEFFGRGGFSGKGSRNRYAIALESFIPLVQSPTFGDVDLTLAVRSDQYDNDANVGEPHTWKWSLQWKPTDNININAVRSTSLRAPDMHYFYADTTFYYTDAIDIDRCINDGNTFSQCENNIEYSFRANGGDVIGQWSGNDDLKPETGATTTFGFMYSPAEDFSFSLDLYEIELKNQVGLQLESVYFRLEAQCNAGQDFISGEPVDPNSVLCQDIYSRISRLGEVFAFIDNEPVNRALRRQLGYDAAMTWFIPSDSSGTFGIDLTHSRVLRTEIQEIAEEPSTYDGNFQNNPRNGEVRSKTNLTFSWAKNDWSAAYSVFRKGSRLNFAGDDYLKPWILNNFVFQKDFGRDVNLNVTVRNLWDEKPPLDKSSPGWPFYDRTQYDAIGREWFLSLKMRY
ncbi:MAG: TonB-dependent receptor [Gammaproteobacteria bacterium]|nr:TonB-dependent receptor [Gammaproteobacteria bacterium]